MLFDEAQSYLLSLGHETLTIKLGLTNTERLLAALGHPHKSLFSIQIAGTNGKGSTAVMLESICRAAGVRVGLFTSPHLISITERIRIDGRNISEPEFARLTKQVKEAVEQLLKKGELQALPTFFEHVTAIALLAFREAGVDLAILETGLGGRLDSTTAAGAQIVAITPIAMDHQEYLGDTLAEIAAEKAAIIKTGVTAIIAPQTDEAMNVVLQRCETVNVRCRLLEENQKPATPGGTLVPARYHSRFCNALQNGSAIVTFETPQDIYENVKLGLPGGHQIANAATAIALAEALREHGFEISHEAIANGIANARHRGRLELWESEPPILFDGAHNPAAAQALREYLDEFVHQAVTLIFGAMRDKALKEIAAILFPAAREVILTELDNPRAATINDLKTAVPRSFDQAKLHEARSVTDALRVAREITTPDSLILITGSLYLVGEVQQSIRESFRGGLPAAAGQ